MTMSNTLQAARPSLVADLATAAEQPWLWLAAVIAPLALMAALLTLAHIVPLALLGLFCVLTAIAVVVYGVYAIASGATDNLRMGLLLPLVFGSFGLRWLQQAFRRPLRVDRNAPSHQTPR